MHPSENRAGRAGAGRLHVKMNHGRFGCGWVGTVVVLGNVCPKAKNGVLTPIIYIFYSKNSCKTAI